MVLALVCSGVLAASPVSETAVPLVPWFVPREISLGVFINPPVATPHFRLAWEGAIVSQPRNELIWYFGLGSGIGLGTPSPMLSHSQHVVVGGFGYRSDHPLITWGFHVAAGGAWYFTAYKPGGFYMNESRALGYIEGRLQFGIRITPHFRVVPYFGYGSPFVFNPRFPGNTFVGGVDTGLVIDWR